MIDPALLEWKIVVSNPPHVALFFSVIQFLTIYSLIAFRFFPPFFNRDVKINYNFNFNRRVFHISEPTSFQYGKTGVPSNSIFFVSFSSDRARAANDYERSAQVVSILGRGNYSPALRHGLHNFAWKHEKYVHPRYGPT